MKKRFTLLFTLFIGLFVHAQNYLQMNITEIQSWQTFDFCVGQYDGVILEKDPSCTNWISWTVTSYPSGEEFNFSTDEITVTNDFGNHLLIQYLDGCDISMRTFYIMFHAFQVTEPWSQDFIWKRTGTSITLEAPYGDDLEYRWSTGSHQQAITVTEPGTYWVRIYNDCGELTDTIQVRDNVEIELATCDLVTNLNMVTWQTTPAQAQYIHHVIVKRDGLNVGTANYSEGSFLDDIGSDLAQRTYTLTAVATDGTECPIVSYPKETIHMAYLTGVNNTIEVNWNTPTGYDLLGYNICEWTPNGKDGDLRVIDFVGASVTSYTCQASQFTSGYVIIQGVEASKPESRLLSNRSSETVDVGEYGMEGFKVYPNPTSGVFTVEGGGHLSVMNLLGQEILAQEIEGKTTLELPKGIYLMRLGSANRKIVVE